MHPALDYIPNKSFNNYVTKFGWSNFPYFPFITKENAENFGKLLFPNRNKFSKDRSFSSTF